MATDPNYAATPNIGAGVVTTGDTSRTAPTNFATIFTAGPSGSRVERISIESLGSIAASTLRLFLHDGANYRLFKEIIVPAVTVSASVTVWEQTIEAVSAPKIMPKTLPSGWSIRMSVNDTQAAGILGIAEGGDF